MNRRRIGIALGAALALASGASAFAQDDASNKSPSGQLQPGQESATMEKGSAARPEDLRTVRITVKETDPKQNKVTFEAQVTPEANVSKDGQPIRINQLEKGDEVRASFDPSTGELVKMQVISGEKKKKSK